MKTKWTKQQPRDGEVVLFCRHIVENLKGKAHWFYQKDYITFARPDGSEGRSRWVAQCPACFIEVP